MYKINTVRAFSLIEIIVVISIVAILSAIAFPAYKKYRVGTMMASAMPAVNDILDRMIKYATINGRFPNARELGYASIGSVYAVDNPKEINPYLAGVTIPNSSPASQCGAIGVVYFRFDPAIVYLGSQSGVMTSNTVLNCNLWHINGTITKQCFASVTNIDFDYNITHYENVMPGLTDIYENGSINNYNLLINANNAQATCIDVLN